MSFYLSVLENKPRLSRFSFCYFITYHKIITYVSHDSSFYFSFLKTIELPLNSDGDVKTLESLLLERSKVANQVDTPKPPPCSTPSEVHGKSYLELEPIPTEFTAVLTFLDNTPAE